MLKNIITIFLIFIGLSVEASDIWLNPDNQKPFTQTANEYIFKDFKIKGQDFKSEDKLNILKSRYNIVSYDKVRNLYYVHIITGSVQNNDLYHGSILYNKDLEALFTSDAGSVELDGGSVFSRFYKVCDKDIEKCGIYDVKSNRFTGFNYNSQDIGNSYSGVPYVIIDGEKLSVQPTKKVLNSIARGLGDTILFPVKLITLPIAVMYIMGTSN